jgi:hypothetical protein
MPRPRSYLLALVSFLGLALACDSSPTSPEGPDVRLDDSFELRPGETATVSGEGLTVSFEGVPADSRCPVDVTCITAGDATVRLRARKAGLPDGEPELHTNDGPHEASYDGYRIVLRKLEPLPRDGVTLTPGDYVATLVVSVA